jgi:hypothetical protein
LSDKQFSAATQLVSASPGAARHSYALVLLALIKIEQKPIEKVGERASE